MKARSTRLRVSPMHKNNESVGPSIRLYEQRLIGIWWLTGSGKYRGHEIRKQGCEKTNAGFDKALPTLHPRKLPPHSTSIGAPRYIRACVSTFCMVPRT